MEFIEMSGKSLFAVVRDEEHPRESLESSGVREDSVVRINRHGEIELRLRDRWELIGGLLGDFDHRIEEATGFTWA